MKFFDAVGFGALNVDRVGMVGKVLSDGEMTMKQEGVAAGGSAGNTIAALGRLGLRIGFLGTVGTDEDGECLLREFKKDHVDTRFITQKHGRSGTVLAVADKKRRAIYIFPGVNSILSQRDIPKPGSFRATLLHLSSFADVRQLRIQIAYLRQLDDKTIVSFSPGMIYARLGMKKIQPILRRAEIVFLTRAELCLLTKRKWQGGARLLLQQGVPTIVVTEGKKGCVVITKKSKHTVSAAPVKMVDPTGAGDAFAAGFLYGVLRRRDLQSCAELGNYVASCSIGALGARTGLPSRMNVLVIGGGGREHSLGWALGRSPLVKNVYVAPGNSGTEEIGKNIPIGADDVAGLAVWADQHRPDLAVVGPEAPLAQGIVDAFEARGFPIFGPSKAAAQLEASKTWAADFMARHQIPHPRFRVFTEVGEAVHFIKNAPWSEIVIKADGLAAGKGVILPDSRDEAENVVGNMLSGEMFGDHGKTIVIQERLNGPEVSVLAFCDGKIAVPLLPARDHKRAFDGDGGPNTGGMGAYAPVPDIDIEEIHWTILQPTVDGMRQEGHPYKGILYAGLMLTAQGPKVLEYNVRFGDPETQPLMMLLKSELAPILLSCINGTLKPEMVRFRPGAAVCVVLASAGYPESSQKGILIHGFDTIRDPNVHVFHAGTLKTESGVVTNGGRVLCMTAYGTTIGEALKRAYGAIGQEGVYFKGMQYRKDIGNQAYGQ